MQSTTINFVHANGFPSGSYQTLFSYLPNNINIIALEKYGHNPKYPVENNWERIVDELVHFVKSQQKNNEKVVCVGHSFGGVVSFMAACLHPELFKGVVMLDPPVVTGPKAFAIKLIKKTRFIDKFSPSGKAINRRKKWPLGTNIIDTFSKRTLFKGFDKRALADYVKSGIVEKNNQLELLFDAKIEAEIFRTLPTNLSDFKNKLTVPTTLIYGEVTEVLPNPHHIFRRFAKQNKKITIEMVSGGHMFPFERPEETAKLIADIIDNLSSG
jgi:pimeloyl-ACP methyl ester carboxylesterase